MDAAEIETLPTAIARLTTRMDAQERESMHWRTETSRQLSELSNKISSLNEALHKGRETNWLPLIGTTATVVFMSMAVGSAVLSPLQATVEETKRAHSELNREVTNHLQLPIHPVAARELENIKRDIEELRTKTGIKP